MAIDANIVNFGQSTPTANALSQFGGQLAGAIQANKQSGLADNRRQAAALLGQAFSDESDDATTTQLIAQARELDPEFVLATMQQVGAGQSKSSIDQQKIDMRKLELEGRALERLLKEETNTLKRTELENKIVIQKQKIEEARDVSEGKETKIETSKNDTLDLLDRMLAHPGLDAAVGGTSLLPTRPGSDSADFEALLGTLQGKQFLNAVQQMKGSGSLSDAEGKKISSAAESLELSMSEGAFREALERIKLSLATAKAPGTFNNDNGGGNTDEVIQWSDL